MTAISDFDIFARVARTGNMSAAGREMGLSPAVVSKRISLLEVGGGVLESTAPGCLRGSLEQFVRFITLAMAALSSST